MTALWYIDSLDARAGYAFASFRQPDLGDPEVILDAPAIMISPPDFRAEFISSRAVGFAAATAGAQAGLFLDGQEVGFPSIPALTEFVRRAYLSGGAGDGGGGGAPIPPGPPDGGEGPSGEDEDGGGPGGKSEAAIAALQDLGSRFVDSVNERPGHREREDSTSENPDSEKKPLGSSGARRFSARMKPAGAGTGRGPPRDTHADLAAGAAIVLQALLASAPPRSGEAKSWCTASQALGRIVLGFGLLPHILRGRYRNAIKRSALDAEGRDPAIFGYDTPSVARDLAIVVGLWSVLPSRFYFPLPLRELVAMGHLPFGAGSGGAGSDPYDEVATWPIPLRVARHARLGREDASVRGLLVAATADPALLASGSTPANESAALVLLAAVHLTCGGRYYGGSGQGSPAFAHAAIVEALAWVDRQMPTYSFAPELEKAIGKTSSLRYASA